MSNLPTILTVVLLLVSDVLLSVSVLRKNKKNHRDLLSIFMGGWCEDSVPVQLSTWQMKKFCQQHFSTILGWLGCTTVVMFAIQVH
jgi:hypothetical protein